MAMFCANTLGDWGTIASFVILAVVLGGLGKSTFALYLRRNPLKILGYYLDRTDDLLERKQFHTKFKDASVNRGRIELKRGRGIVYIELEPRLPHILIAQVSLRFKGKKNGEPKLQKVSDITHPFALIFVYDSEGITFEYQEKREMFKGQKYYYGFIYDAPDIWAGALSFTFSLSDLGRRLVRRTCIVVEM